MCELFGVSSDRKIRINDYLNTFYKRSVEHHNGWGLALLDDGIVSIEKEPVRAVDSQYLKNRLTGSILTSRCMAHIRKATIGDVSFCKTHPFAMNDNAGRKWVLVHNGTVFDAPELSPYQYTQEGTTDSERILLYVVDRVNNLGDAGDDTARMALIDEMIHTITPGNKINFLLYDGEYLYVHKNEPGTMYSTVKDGAVIIATHPLDKLQWKEIPQNQLLVFRDGSIVYEGKPHDNTYHHDESKMRLIYMDHAML